MGAPTSGPVPGVGHHDPVRNGSTERLTAERARGALVVVVGVLVVYTFARRWVGFDGWVGVVAPLSVAALCVAAALAAGLDRPAVGLDRADVGSGLRRGGAWFAAIASGVVIAVAIPATRHAFEDTRVAVSAWSMLATTLVVIPLGTVVPEELIFRGSILGLAQGWLGTRRGRGLSALLFGLWHIAPTLSTATGNAATADVAASAWGLAATTTLMVLAMTAAGWFLDHVRIRSGSVAAPMLVHFATNSVTFAAAWAVGHYGW